ncbi:uncharacterized protein MELLADRAFT_106029 [Melampsora larici-populina 98AG31]|uniref:F-box domain-containing protein n=1 Tax=Melampsora larici-populina (strain 98AG31 / pathotype 3-4-7) TaxID=747676 RepID=F4RK50_MELLP|nr:uncharacterized protein MELLADRAFT_106029 [Melampsora larici-populina 98AG31]EGG07036.1 hypothetical protein MELLADRAFT_106029 [Melampsora larici-populina 98AG31]
MLDRLPTELQEIIIYHLIDLTYRGTRLDPLKRRSDTDVEALTLIKLSQVNSKLHQICRPILWKNITYIRKKPSQPGHKLKEYCDQLSSHPHFNTEAQNVRYLKIKTFFVVEEVLLGLSYDLAPSLKHLFYKSQHLNIQHISLCIGVFLTGSMEEELLDSKDQFFKHFRYFYRSIINSLKNFSHLTSLEVSGTCFCFLSENEIGQCVLHLPNLTRFRAHGYFMHGSNEDQIQGLRLGQCLASLTLLEQLSLENMSDPDSSWCELDWKGPLETLHLKHCSSFDDHTLCKLIFKLPTLKKVRIVNSSSLPAEKKNDGNPMILQHLESFTSFGSLDPELINVLSSAPNLQKIHLHTGLARFKVPQKIKTSIQAHHTVWPRLKSMVLSYIHPRNPDRIFLENWARKWNIRIKFHRNVMSYSTAWAMGGLVDDQELYHQLDNATEIKQSLLILKENSELEEVQILSNSIQPEGAPSDLDDVSPEFDQTEQESWDGGSDSELSSVGGWTESQVDGFFPVL